MGVATNATFDALFLASERFFDDMVRHKTISTLLLAR
jgi:hypothetical protein